MRSNFSSAKALNQSLSTNDTLAPSTSALHLATLRASLLLSQAQTCALGQSSAIVTAMQPLPVPRSSTRGVSRSLRKESASSMSVSVSGRGMSVAGVT